MYKCMESFSGDIALELFGQLEDFLKAILKSFIPVSYMSLFYLEFMELFFRFQSDYFTS